MIIISWRVWIIRIFIIKVYGILTVDVLIKMNLIVLEMCDFNVNTNWLIFGGVSSYYHVKIVMFWKFKFLGLDLRRISVERCRRPILSGLLCLFLFLGLGPMCDEFRTWASNLVIFLYLSSF